MKTWKITEIWNINEWNWPHWVTYYISLKLDNWEQISLWKQKKDAFKVWDEVKYEEYTNSKWNKAWKEVRENNGWRKPYGDNGKGAMVWMALKIAFDKAYNWEDDFQKAAYLAQRIYNLAVEMTNGSWSENKADADKTANESTDLPI